MAPPTTENISSGELQQLVANLTTAASNYDPSPQGLGSRMNVMQQAKEIMLALAGPMDMVGIHSSQMSELVALRTLLSLKVFTHFPESGSISLADLSQATGTQGALLERLLRILVCTGFVVQTDKLEYAHTKFSRAYAQWPGPGLAFQLLYDESFLQICRFHLYIQEKGLKEPEDHFYSPINWTEKQEGKSIWEVMSSFPERAAVFQMGLPFIDKSVPILGYYDFGKLKPQLDEDRPVLVDIGGGIGATIGQILAAYPQLPSSKFVLEDRAPPLAEAAKAGYLPKDVQMIEYDFFGAEQPVKNAKAYYLRRVLHDYSDKVCAEILKRVVPAMGPDSLVLVSDFVVPERVTPADIAVATMGVTILNMGGKERTVTDFKNVFSAAGLEVTGVFVSDFGSTGMIEGRLARKA